MKQSPASLSFALSVLLTPLAIATDGTWSATAGGNWSDPLNWNSGAIADGSAATASFTSDIAAATTVTLDSSRSIGSLVFSDAGAAGNAWMISSNTLTLAGGATPVITAGTDATIASIVGGTQGLSKGGTGQLTLSGLNTYTGTTAVNAGKLTVAPTVNVGNNGTRTQSSTGYTVATGTTLRFDASAVQGGTAFAIWDINPVSVSSGGTLELYSTSTIHSNVATNALLLYWGNADQISGSGSINKEGDGVIDINGNGTLTNFTGAININAGWLALQGGPTTGAGNFAVNVASGATFDLRTDAHKIGGLNGAGSVVKSHPGVPGTFTLGNGNGDGSFSGTFTDQAAPNQIPVIKTGTGTQIFSGAVSYRGTTTINGGKLVIDGTSTNSAFTVNNGGTLGGAGSIGGTVSVESGGIIAPGSGTGSPVGMLTVNNTLTLKTGSTTRCELKKTTGVLSNDQLFVNSVVYGGTLEVTASGDALAAGDEFKLFDSVAYAGSFGSVTLPSLPGALVWDQSSLATTGTIRVSNLADTPVFSPGDGNCLAPQLLTMTSGSGTTVYYTFVSGGAEPPNPTTASASGAPGSGVATLNLPTTGIWKVKAMAAKPGLGNSAVALGSFTLIPTPVWTNPDGGFWSDLVEDAVNWQGGVVASGSGIPADFSTLTLPVDAIVTLDGDRTIGSLIFGDVGNQFPWTLDGSSTLTLAGAAPSIGVNNQLALVTAPLAGTQGLVKTGAGEAVLGGFGTLSGPIAINQGTLSFRTPANAAWTLMGGTKTVASGATMKIDMSPQATQHLETFVGATALNTGAILELYGTNANANNFYVLGNGWTPSGSGTVKVTGGASIAMKAADFANFTGTLEIENGQFSNNSPNANPNFKFNVNVASGSKLDMRTDSLTMNTLNGSGSVMKSFNGFPGVLTLGNGDGSGNFSGAMTSQATSYSLVKTGTGTQTLGGALSYGGTTTVNGGTLAINGTSTGSAFTVNTGGTLGGTGSIAGSVSIQAGGAIAPGAGAGTLATGATTIAGTYACELNGASADKLAAAGVLDVSAGTLAITTLGGGATQPAYIIATYTGAAPAPFAAVTGLPEGYTLNYAYNNGVTTTNIALVSGANDYGSWESANGIAGAGSTVDSDNDGIANGIEFVIGGDPSGPGSDSSGLLPLVTLDATYMSFSFRRSDASATYNPYVEYSTTLAPAAWTHAQPGVGGVIVDEENDFFGGGTDRVTVRIPRALAAPGSKFFARLHVDIP